MMGNASLVRTIFLIFLVILASVALLYLAWTVFETRIFNFERPPRVQQIAPADLNGNGRLDAFLAIAPDGEPYIHADYLLLNEGNGRVTASSRVNFRQTP